MTIKEIQNEIKNEFDFMDDWEQRYEYLIDLGREMTPIAEEKKTEHNVVKGCQSTVWLSCEMKDGKLYFEGDSDAILPKGMVALLLKIYDNQTPTDILESGTDAFKDMQLHEFLSPTRANGLTAIIKQIKFYALAYESKIKSEP
ncbi:MAG: SufE family protein [Weeksellaceae bacterium]